MRELIKLLENLCNTVAFIVALGLILLSSLSWGFVVMSIVFLSCLVGGFLCGYFLKRMGCKEKTLYVIVDNDERIMNLNPYECIDEAGEGLKTFINLYPTGKFEIKKLTAIG